MDNQNYADLPGGQGPPGPPGEQVPEDQQQPPVQQHQRQNNWLKLFRHKNKEFSNWELRLKQED